MSRFYSFSYDTVLELPLKVFTLYNSTIGRLRAEEDLRYLNVVASSDSAEAYTKTSERLTEELGQPIQFQRNALVKAEPDALEKLKRLQESGR